MFYAQSKQVKLEERMRIAFVGSCLPRKCGIATFSANLSHALEKNAGFDTAHYIALNNNGGFDYPPRVIFEVEQDNLEGYYQAASLINSFGVDVVSLQHEFGLFGGPDGNYITEFLRYLRKPVVTTCHTVLEYPSSGQKKAFMKTAALSQALVVMNKLAISFMTDIYNIPHTKIRLIPHGVPETEYRYPSYYKPHLQLQDRFLILTFGFLSPNKGIETMLKALPDVVEKHPHVLYIILGITHPVEKKHNGEVYRKSLESLVDNLKLNRNVLFVDAFVDDENMDCYVGAADLVVCPYHSEAQITSGVLSTALSKGKAIISTPFLHAKEALAGGRGKLVNTKDPADMSAAVLHLLENPRERDALSDKAYALGRQMGWSSVSRQYLEAFTDVMEPKEKERTRQRVRMHPLPVSI